MAEVVDSMPEPTRGLYGSKMGEIPDRVIEEATSPGAWMVADDFACHNEHDGSTPCHECWRDAEKVVRAAAPVIAGWAEARGAAQERERVNRLVVAVRAYLAPLEGVEVTLTEVAGELMAARIERLDAALAALDGEETL